MMKILTKEPLIPALLAAAGLFWGSQLLDGQSQGSRFIQVQEGQIHALVVEFERRHKRLPSDGEYRALLDSFVRSEIMYRSAIELGLDQDDNVVKRHLRQKLEFITGGFADVEPPSLVTLQAFVEDNHQEFTQPDLFTFEQVFLDPRRRNDISGDAADLLAELNSSDNAQSIRGDRSTLKRRFNDITALEVERLFGVQAMRAVERAEQGLWLGPVRSPLGYHLLYIDHVRQGQLIDVEQHHAYVLERWDAHLTTQTNEANYQDYRQKYTVVIEDTPRRHDAN
ncbi:peptidyl-prolyl cis-trans isomerase [Vibrio sp. WXL210]|uniref:peptidylprolyl isomerase n=1 Tax=Vibrio sp. WXL210 TaxID=3450709 RepID=UPI003EC76E89